MLSLQTAIVARIESQVPDFKTVDNPSVLVTTREMGPLLPACIIVPGAGDPGEIKNPALPVLETQEWDVIVIVAHQVVGSEDGQTEAIAGALMNGVLKALHGWKDNSNPQKHGWIYAGRERPSYNLGYAEFPMTFHAKAVIGQ